jgi:phage gp29-like protein
MWDFFNRFAAKKDDGPADGRGAPKSQSAQEFDELFNAWCSMTGVKLTGKKLQQTLRDADEGNCSDQAALIDVMQEVEPVIGSHLDTRKRAALAKPWRLEGGSEKDRKEITTNLESIGFQHLRRNSLDALAHGYNASALLWAPGGAKLTGWKEVHATNVLFDLGGNPGLVTRSGDKSLSEWHPNQFMFHIHKTKPGLPCRGSIVRSLAWNYFFKFYSIRDYARYIERFGIPFTLAKLNEADFADGAKTTRIINALRSLGTNGVAAVTKATDIETPDVAGGGKAEFFNWFQYNDDIYALVILGQIASSKEANGMSNGDLQSGVKDDLTVSDCEQEEETYNNSIIKPMDRFRNGRETGIKIVIDSSPPEDMQAKALLVTTLADGGYRAKREWVEKTFDIPLEDKDDTPADTTKPTDRHETVKALSDASNTIAESEDVTATLTENTLRELFSDNEAFSEFHKPLTAAVRDSFGKLDPDDPELEKKFIAAADVFFEKYPALYEEINTDRIEKAVSGAMLASKLNGYSRVLSTDN